MEPVKTIEKNFSGAESMKYVSRDGTVYWAMPPDPSKTRGVTTRMAYLGNRSNKMRHRHTTPAQIDPEGGTVWISNGKIHRPDERMTVELYPWGVE